MQATYIFVYNFKVYSYLRMLEMDKAETVKHRFGQINEYTSIEFKLKYGIKQSGRISSLIFVIYIDKTNTKKLRKNEIGNTSLGRYSEIYSFVEGYAKR